MGLDAITTNSLSTLGGGIGRGNAPCPGNPRFNLMAPSNQNLLNMCSPVSDSNVSVVSGLCAPVHAPAVSVYVYGLQPTHDELTLYKLFAPFGAVINVKLIRDLTKEDRPCKGYGFVNFARYEDAHSAVVSMNNVPFEEKILQVSFKQSKIDVKVGSLSYFEK